MFREFGTRIRRCWRAPTTTFSLNPPLSFKKVSTAIAFTRYLLIVTALLRRHKSTGYDHLSGHSAVRGNLPMDYYLRRDCTMYICTFTHTRAHACSFHRFEDKWRRNFTEIDIQVKNEKPKKNFDYFYNFISYKALPLISQSISLISYSKIFLWK